MAKAKLYYTSSRAFGAQGLKAPVSLTGSMYGLKPVPFATEFQDGRTPASLLSHPFRERREKDGAPSFVLG